MINNINIMGKRGIVVVMLFALIWGFSQAGWAQDAKSPMGRLWIHRMEGDALIRVEGNDEWAAAAINFPLRRGDQLWTTQGASVQGRLRHPLAGADPGGDR
ncbi:MAG: hypothetical protein JRG73_05580 [Deltaproteobacteria bacterium]|nr:hypothetical protein [Deltaproteobacteria bacterium]